MAEQGYDLMHNDDVVASLQLDDLSGAILKVTPSTNPELLPLGGSQGADSLRKWWLRRAVPISQGNIAALLQQEGIPSTQSLLMRNLGLSLSDHYWIKPSGSELTWKDVSLFSTAFAIHWNPCRSNILTVQLRQAPRHQRIRPAHRCKVT